MTSQDPGALNTLVLGTPFPTTPNVSSSVKTSYHIVRIMPTLLSLSLYACAGGSIEQRSHRASKAQLVANPGEIFGSDSTLPSGFFADSTNVGTASLTLHWTLAGLDPRLPMGYQYLLCLGASPAEIDSIQGCEGATKVMEFTRNVTSKIVTGLSPATTYFFNIVLLSDKGTKSVYLGKTQATSADNFIRSPAAETQPTPTPTISDATISNKVINSTSSGEVPQFDQKPSDSPPVAFGIVNTSIVAGDRTSCVISNSGSLKCWGNNREGALGDGTTINRSIPTQIGTATDWKMVSTGAYYSCATKADGSIWCWGKNSFETIFLNSTVSYLIPTRVGVDNHWESVSTSMSHRCGRKSDGSIWCWGLNGAGQLGDGTQTGRQSPVQVGTDKDWADVSASTSHTCARKISGSLWCWGSNANGMSGNATGLLGNGSKALMSLVPQRVSLTHNWTAFSVGRFHTCALSLGQLFCWGANWDGQLGTGNLVNSSVPLQVGSDNDWALVSARGDFTCALKLNGTLWCWGANHNEQIGAGLAGRLPSPRQFDSATDWTHVSAGMTHVCGKKANGNQLCWGDNRFEQLGVGLPGKYKWESPVQVGDNSDWTAVEAGVSSSCGIKSGGSLWCWGQIESGQAGDTTTRASLIPVRIGPADKTWTMVTPGSHSCGRQSAGTILCWGENHRGEVGYTTLDYVSLPTHVSTPLTTGWLSVHSSSSSGQTTCARRDNRTIWCWGENTYGQVGNGYFEPFSGPAQVGIAQDWLEVRVGQTQSCALKTNGTAWCWGKDYGSYEESNNAIYTGSMSAIPIQIGTDMNWTSLSLGADIACGRKNDGTIWCWSSYSDYLIGDTTIDRNTPRQVGTQSDWVSVSTGGVHACGKKTDGTLWCWGSNSSGQLADVTGEGDDYRPPQKIGTASDWESVSAGFRHTCGRKTDGTIWCWGANWDGQLADPKTWSATPLSVLGI